MKTDAMPGIPDSEAALPEGIRSGYAEANGLCIHYLEAGDSAPERPCVLLLHGFPELAYSWRHNMLPLAELGYHVIAPDLRGCGETTGWEQGYGAELHPFGTLNMVTDAIALVTALGHREVQMVAGHDAGVQIAAYASLIRPDLFRSAVLMSIPFAGAPGLFSVPRPFEADPIHRELCSLNRPRKHYTLYFSSEKANTDLMSAPQGIQGFLRAYFHMKSADWKQNRPHPLEAWSAGSLSEMPVYYIMDLDSDMPSAVAPYMPNQEESARCGWLTDAELSVYAAAYQRTGFQGALNWYRNGTNGLNARETRLFAGRTLDVPVLFLAGKQDWGPYQFPGALEAMSHSACTDFRGISMIEGAGHWVQQEAAPQVSQILADFLTSVCASGKKRF